MLLFTDGASRCSERSPKPVTRGPESNSHLSSPDPEIPLSACPQVKLVAGDRKQRGSHILNGLPNKQAKLIFLIGVGTADLLSAKPHPHSTVLFLPEETGPIAVLMCLH